MTESKPDAAGKKIAGFLSQYETRPPAPDLAARVEASLQTPAVKAVTRRNILSYVMLEAAMAAAVLGVFLYLYRHHDTAATIVAPAAPLDGWLYLAATQPDSPEATAYLYRLRTLRTESIHVGDACAYSTLTAIHAQSLDFKDITGKSETRTRGQWREQFMLAATGEVTRLQAALPADAGDIAAFGRLSQLSMLQCPAAIHLLEALAAASGPWQESARAALGHRKEGEKIDVLVARVIDPATRYRHKLIAVLGKVRAPLALSTLAELVRRGKEVDEIRQAAAQSLADFGNISALDTMQALLQDGDLPVTVMDTLTRGIAKLLPAPAPDYHVERHNINNMKRHK